ncbi:O-antigen polymerase [Spongiivirga sp. MCCC 1A20706]|uniref:O-antigen polymerase n=1 Tax=Spongiivirga sp. MCCC 1A20706 TaxID=3160963 RepID=UPI00397797E6
MIFLFIIYLFVNYFFISKKILNVCTVGLLYILLSILFGKYTIEYSAQWVSQFDLSYARLSVKYLEYAYYTILLTIFFLQLFFPEKRLRNSTRINLKGLISANSSWILILILSIPLYLVFISIYFPVFQDKTFVSKYFQDRLAEFIPYRPFYTLSINSMSTLLFLQLNYFLLKNRNFNIYRVLVNKKFAKILFMSISLFFTAKRGQLFFPFFISLVSYLIYRRKVLGLTIFSSLALILISISRNINQLLTGTFKFEDALMSFSTSFFVSVRELARVLYSFEIGGYNYLYGKTYIAGFFSFIPTSINTLKANYNYMRYTSVISGQNPDDFGGMRSTFVGEAYINFGVFGIISCSVFFALLMYFVYLWIKKYSTDSFVYFLFTLWCLKLIIFPFYENGSAMLLFFLITILFMIIPSIKLSISRGRLALKLKFLNKNA